MQQPSELHRNDTDQRDDAAFWNAVRPQREPVGTRWFVPLVLVFLVLGVPWHARLGWTAGLLGGLPVWVWASLLSALGLAITTATAGLTSWRDPEIEGAGEDDGDAGS